MGGMNVIGSKRFLWVRTATAALVKENGMELENGIGEMEGFDGGKGE